MQSALALLAVLFAAVATVAAPEPTGHGTYPKIEASFTLPVDGNPYDYTVNDVQVTLATPDGDMTLPAFYDGDDTWRVRHTPPTPGKITVKNVTLNGKPVADLAVQPTTFDVDGAPAPGFVRIADDGMHFAFDDGTSYYPLGYNLAWHHRGQPEMPELPVSIGRMGANGVNWTRIWMNHWDTKNLDWIEEPQFKQPPLGEYSLDAARKWDAILDAAEANDVHLQMVLQHHGQYSSSTNSNWETNPWNAANGGFLQTPAEFFTNEQAKELTRKKYRYIIARYGYSPAIMAWELWNEVHYTDAWHDAPETVFAWHEEMADFIRKNDPYHHLITTSSVVEEPKLWTAMDYYQHHQYPTDVLTAIDNFDQTKWDKPYFYGEIGSSTSEFTHEQDQTVQRILWGGLMSEASGAAEYWYWYNVEPNGYLKNYAAASKFIDLAGLADARDLRRIDVIPQTGELGPLTFGLGLDWHPSTSTSATVAASGKVTGNGGMSAFLQGDNNRDMFPFAEFRLDFGEPGNMTVRVDQISTTGGNLEVHVDGRHVTTVTLNPTGRPPENGEERPSRVDVAVDVPLPAGEHTVKLVNTGTDWVHLRDITLDPYAPGVAVLAKGGENLTVLWAYRRDMDESDAGPLKATLTVPDMPAGAYTVQWFDTHAGTIMQETTVQSDGSLVLEAPPIQTDIAAIIRPASGKTANVRR